MKAFAAKLLVLLFAALVIQCAFDADGVQAATATPSQGGNALCGNLSAASVQIALPNQPPRQVASGEAVPPLRDILPLWTLAQLIDHPPELLA